MKFLIFLFKERVIPKYNILLYLISAAFCSIEMTVAGVNPNALAPAHTDWIQPVVWLIVPLTIVAGIYAVIRKQTSILETTIGVVTFCAVVLNAEKIGEAAIDFGRNLVT